MQDPRISGQEEMTTKFHKKKKKKKSSTRRASSSHQQEEDNVEEEEVQEVQEVQVPLPLKSGHKGSKRNLMTEISPLFQKPQGSNSDSLPDSSSGGNDYRALRRRYLLLEDENFALGRELRAVEGEVKILEDEKQLLLDQLVVLEGLVDPSAVQPQRFHIAIV